MSGRLLAAALLLVTLALAGCGGSKGSSSQSEAAASWTDGLCSSLVTWQESLKSAASDLTSGQINSDAIQEMAAALPKANAKLKADLQALGKPPTTGAPQAKSAVTGLADSVNHNLTTIQTALSGISGAQDIPAAASAVGTAVTATADELTSTREQLQTLADDDPWNKAFEDSDACQKLQRD